MLQYDLSNTPLAHSTEPIATPSEGELLAIMLGLMLVCDCSFSELGGRTLVLSRELCEPVATTIEKRHLPLTRDIGSGEALRQRLAGLVGLSVYTSGWPPAGPRQTPNRLR